MCSLSHPLRKGGSSSQRRAGRVEIGLEGGTRTVHRTDDRKRGDQTKFDRGRSRLIRKELRDETPQATSYQGLRCFYPAMCYYIRLPKVA